MRRECVSELKATFPSLGSDYTFETGVMAAGARTAYTIFNAGEQTSGMNSYSSQWPDGWSTQPNCKRFGINLDDNYRHARFGFQANQENNCGSHDTAAGLGLGDQSASESIGAGDMCRSSGCNHGYTLASYQGLLWGR